MSVNSPFVAYVDLGSDVPGSLWVVADSTSKGPVIPVIKRRFQSYQSISTIF